MKIKLGKLLTIVSQVIVAAPAVIAAIKPVVEAAKKSRRVEAPPS